jgi:O-acetyl-ADP-ribose deacetylase (regulator of RNase III)
MIIGNLIDLTEQGLFDVIVHGCNCFHTMGAGIAKEIKERYPEAYEADALFTSKGDKSKLGKYTWVKVKGPKPLEHEFFITNAYTQYYFGDAKKHGPMLDYDAVSSVFSMINSFFGGLRIGYPKIGAGLAGGDWDVISNIINKELTSCKHELVVLK